MSKGNLFVGSASGKVGNLVLANTAQGQITRVYQPKVKNPKTRAQMKQRAKFADAVKFFKEATDGFFKFAYEDKAKNESDYNAFMRHNIKYALPMSHELYENTKVPAFGNLWQLSQGRISNIFAPQYYATGGPAGENSWFLALVSATDGATVGDVSSSLISLGAEAGDIVTIVGISSALTLDMVKDPSTITDDVKSPAWSVLQFDVDTDDTTAFTDINHLGSDKYEISVATAGSLALKLTTGTCQFCGVVVTRKVDSGLYATTSYLQESNDAKAIRQYLQEDDTIRASLKSWGATSNPILKGLIAGLLG